MGGRQLAVGRVLRREVFRQPLQPVVEPRRLRQAAFDDPPNDKRFSDPIETVTADPVFLRLPRAGLTGPVWVALVLALVLVLVLVLVR